MKELNPQVHTPPHYALFPDAEVIDVIRKVLTATEFEGYCKGNILKYKLRAGEKDDPIQDLEKAAKYQEWLFESAV